ncbi:His-Xaa-Ser system protein HxsD [Neopusillimonas maritima]|uniref:His-Xaa-Ser system protein HxsD n=1 Tax=Neopusillimonas maritima TaxID=2026239 RepID=A0ABX9MYV5_9BURK|nr:His-Xaa-Ser system protein HxsD [Neopusillimonas maritima]RII84018.1 His-Xaa-Ser system protein HxsD [Neopusillimonas maritima]
MKLNLNKEIYSIEATQKAAYRFIDRLTILIEPVGDELVCTIDPVEGHEERLDDHVANFKRELLDQQLRKQIKEETEAVRNLILAYTFSRTGLQG